MRNKIILFLFAVLTSLPLHADSISPDSIDGVCGGIEEGGECRYNGSAGTCAMVKDGCTRAGPFGNSSYDCLHCAVSVGSCQSGAVSSSIVTAMSLLAGILIATSFWRKKT